MNGYDFYIILKYYTFSDFATVIFLWMFIKKLITLILIRLFCLIYANNWSKEISNIQSRHTLEIKIKNILSIIIIIMPFHITPITIINTIMPISYLFY